MDLFEKVLEYLCSIWSPEPRIVYVEVPTPVPVPAPLPAPVLLTLEQLGAIMPKLPMGKATEYLPLLLSTCSEFKVDTKLRLAAFLAQLAHESLDLSIWQENLNYSAAALQATWPKRFDAAKAAEYARKPEKIANHVYANRLGNGDEASGEGWKYRGRGPIQLTGKENYKLYGTELKVDLVADPEKLLTPEVGFRVAALFWTKKGLNELADKGDLKEITKRINGGYIGLEHREAIYKKAKEVLGVV